MSGHALSADQFARYAREQIHAADALLTRHQPTGGSYCRCGRPLPCGQAETIAARKTHYLSRLGLTEATQPLPIVASAVAPPPQAHGLRRLLARLTREVRRGDV